MWSYAKAVAAIERLGLADGNLRLACYWLSLWDGDTPPTRAQFNPSKVPDVLPGIALSEVRPDVGIVCRLSGTALDKAIGRPIGGTNLLDYVPEDLRSVRLDRLTAIVSGGLSVSRTAFSNRAGDKHIAETLQLPFAGMSEDGARSFIAHLNWRLHMGGAVEKKPGLSLGFPETFIAIGIT
jgi:hypothetical protein